MRNVRTARRRRRSSGPKTIVMTTRYPLDHQAGSKASQEHLWAFLAVRRAGESVTCLHTQAVGGWRGSRFWVI